jgi:hypothetical protein
MCESHVGSLDRGSIRVNLEHQCVEESAMGWGEHPGLGRFSWSKDLQSLLDPSVANLDSAKQRSQGMFI